MSDIEDKQGIKQATTGITLPIREVNPRLRQLREAESLRIPDRSALDDPSDATPNEPLELPRFIIDLSLPPEKRYAEVCAAFGEEMQSVQSLFDDVFGAIFWFMPGFLITIIGRVLFRGLYCSEETAELQGISSLAKVPLYKLVALNLLLDILMGCSSGGAAVQGDASTPGSMAKMMHFRNMDWGMPSLRRVLLQQDFVLEPEGEVVASTIAYAGYVGVITGVRKGLSVSLNFREVRINSHSWAANFKYVSHQIKVLLGLRPSIISVLRGYLLPRTIMDKETKRREPQNATPKTYAEVVQEAGCQQGTLITSACYLIFSSGHETTVIEKDLSTAICRSRTDFIVATNADETAMDASTHIAATQTPIEECTDPSDVLFCTREESIQESKDRKICVEQNYKELCRIRGASPQAQKLDSKDREASAAQLPHIDDIKMLIQTYPTLNEATHYSAIMDATQGTIAWSRYWRKPLRCL